MQNKKFPLNTAGSRMITAFPRVQIGETIRDVERMLVKKARTFDTLDYVYVTDEYDVLHGVISIKEILGISRKDVKIEEVMKKIWL